MTKSPTKPGIDEEEAAFGRAARKLLFGARVVEERPAVPEVQERQVRVKVTMNLDGDLVQHFKQRAKREGRPYQFLINEALRQCVEGSTVERLASQVSVELVKDESFLERLSSTLQGRCKTE